MSNEYEALYLDNTLLPKHLDLTSTPVANAAKNRTINGTLYVDFQNNLRSWEVKWGMLTRAEVDAILAKYYLQFSEGRMLNFAIPGKGISTSVYVNVSPDSIKYNGQYSNDFTVVLEEAFAIS